MYKVDGKACPGNVHGSCNANLIIIAVTVQNEVKIYWLAASFFIIWAQNLKKINTFVKPITH